MKRFSSLLIITSFISVFFFACEDEHGDRNPAPPEIQGDWYTIASQDMASGTYEQYQYVKFHISENDGKYFAEDHQVSENNWQREADGEVNWIENGDGRCLELYVDDYRQYQINISTLEDNYFFGTLEWGGEQKKWIFVKDRTFTIYGFVQSNNQPVENAIAFLEISDNQVLTDTTLSCGLFWFSNLNTTEDKPLTVKKLGYQDYSGRAMAHDWILSITNNIVLEQGSSSLSSATIGGCVYDEQTGQALSGVNVGYGDSWDEYTSTDFEGNYSLQVPAGNLTIEASVPGYVTAHEKVETEGSQSYQVDFHLTRSIDISGLALDQNGRGISEVKVTLYNDENTVVGSMLTKNNGSYNFTGIPAGMYTIRIQKTGYSFTEDEIILDVDEPITGMDFTGIDLSAKPVFPEKVNATDGEYDSYIRITWEPVINADEYKVYRAHDAYGNYEEVSSWISDTVFEDSSIPDASTYYYTVKARNNNGTSNLSDYTSGYAITGGGGGSSDPVSYVYGIYLRGRASATEYIRTETELYDPLWQYVYENPEGTIREIDMDYKPSASPEMPYILTDTTYFMSFADTCGAVATGTIPAAQDVQSTGYYITTSTGTLNFTGDSEVSTAVFDLVDTMTIHGDGSWTVSYSGTITIDGTVYNASEYLEDINGGG